MRDSKGITRTNPTMATSVEGMVAAALTSISEEDRKTVMKIDKDGVEYLPDLKSYLYPDWDDVGNFRMRLSDEPPTDEQRSEIQRLNKAILESDEIVQSAVRAGVASLARVAIMASYVHNPE